MREIAAGINYFKFSDYLSHLHLPVQACNQILWFRECDVCNMHASPFNETSQIACTLVGVYRRPHDGISRGMEEALYYLLDSMHEPRMHQA